MLSVQCWTYHPACIVCCCSSSKTIAVNRTKFRSITTHRARAALVPHPTLFIPLCFTSGMFSSMIRRVTIIQFLRFRTASTLWATKSSVNRKKSLRGLANLSVIKTDCSPPPSSQDHCCQPYLGLSGGPWGQVLAGSHHIVCSWPARGKKIEKGFSAHRGRFKDCCTTYAGLTLSCSICSGFSSSCTVRGGAEALMMMDIWREHRQARIYSK